MGIRQLRANLTPYGEHAVLGYSSATSNVQDQNVHGFTKIAVDGLAFGVSYLLQATCM